MKIKVKITTPKGSAKKVSRKLKPFILGRLQKFVTYTNKVDDTVYFEVEDTPKRIIKIQKNVARFDYVIQAIMKSQKIRKIAKLNAVDISELDDMLLKHTTCTILKEATAEEIQKDDMTFWERVKKTFKRS